MGRGSYQLNPELQLYYTGQWISVNDLSGKQDISEDEIRKHSLGKRNKELEEFRIKYEKSLKKRERDRWRW